MPKNFGLFTKFHLVVLKLFIKFIDSDEEVGFDENCEECEQLAANESATPRLPSPVDTTNLEPSEASEK